MRTVQAADAHHVATRDREATANMVLELAVDEALGMVRDGRRYCAQEVLLLAGVKAERILGRAS